MKMVMDIDNYETKFNDGNAGCAALLQEKGIIEMHRSLTKAYVWDQQTRLWKVMNTAQLRPLISKILDEERQRVYDIIKKNITEESKNLDVDDDNTKLKRMKKKLDTWNARIKVCVTSASYLDNVIKMCGELIDAEESEVTSKYNASKHMLPIRGGDCVDLRSGEVRKREKSDYFTYELDVSIVEDTSNAQRFFKSLFPDTATTERVQEILGYMATKWTFLKKFFVFWGRSGDNGKSVMLSLLDRALGRNCTSISEALFVSLKNVGNSPTPELIQILDKTVGYFGETTDKYLNETVIKMITGNDKVSVRRMREEYFDTYLTAKIALVGNEKPSWRHSRAMTQRLELIPFLFTFVDKPNKKQERKKDPEFIDKLKGEHLDEVFTFIVQGAIRLWRNKKLTDSRVCSEALQSYIDEVNTGKRFITTMLKKSKTFMKRTEVLQTYSNWCHSNSICVEKKGTFYEKLEKVYPKSTLNGYDGYYVDIIDDYDDSGFSLDVGTPNEAEHVIKYIKAIREQDEVIRDLQKTIEQYETIMKMRRPLKQDCCVVGETNLWEAN